MAVRGAESTQDPFAFDCRHQLVDAEIGLGAFVGVRRPVALPRLPSPAVADAEMLIVFSSSMEARILLYCMVVAVARASVTAVLLVAAADRAPKLPSSCFMKEAGAPVI